MQISGTCYICISMVVLASVFLANIISIIAVYSLEEFHLQDGSGSSKSIPSKSDIQMGASVDNLIWFLQVSDLHLSIFHDKSRISDLKDFCSVTVKVISPSVVIASGDLTDAKAKDNMGSRQYEREWVIYRDVLNESNVMDHTVWLDIRGNHDNFNVLGLNSKYNYFRSFSIQGRNHPKSYLYQVRGSQDNVYSFIGLDACIEPGPKRPFNFIGMLKQKDIDVLKEIKEKTEVGQRHYNIWFGHYPTSCIITPSDFHLRKFIGSDPASLAYLCGHLHNMGGVVYNMYALQQAGFLELELIDWKESRMFRLAAIDHGLLSFIDVHHGQWPLILITNPKNLNYWIPAKESFETVLNSTHVRILVFSPSEIKIVKVKLHDRDWKICDHVQGPLYIAEWNPYDFAQGVHFILVEAQDVGGRTQSMSHSFALDHPRNEFNIFPRLLLMANLSSAFQVMFGIMISGSILPLCFARILDRQIIAGKMKKPVIRTQWVKNWVRRVWLLANINGYFFPLIFYPLFLAFGPWCIGEIVEDHFGVIFAWGILVNGMYLPGGFTYAYGFFQLFLFHTPLMLFLSHSLDSRIKPCNRNRRHIVSKIFNLVFNRNLAFFLLLSFQTSLALSFSLAYGFLAFFLSPLRTWPIFLALWLWLKSNLISERVIRNAASIWLDS